LLIDVIAVIVAVATEQAITSGKLLPNVAEHSPPLLFLTY
jgi:hypothetical protein